MDLLENGHCFGCQLVYVILMLGSEGDVIQLLLEMTHFNDGLGLRYLKHLP